MYVYMYHLAMISVLGGGGCAWAGAGEIMVTKHVPADINPIWNTSFSIRGVSEVDRLEFVCIDHGVLTETHTFGLGPKRVARGVCKISDGSFTGWID